MPWRSFRVTHRIYVIVHVLSSDGDDFPPWCCAVVCRGDPEDWISRPFFGKSAVKVRQADEQGRIEMLFVYVLENTDMIGSTTAATFTFLQKNFQIVNTDNLLDFAVCHNQGNVLRMGNDAADFSGDCPDVIFCHAAGRVQGNDD